MKCMMNKYEHKSMQFFLKLDSKIYLYLIILIQLYTVSSKCLIVYTES